MDSRSLVVWSDSVLWGPEFNSHYNSRVFFDPLIVGGLDTNRWMTKTAMLVSKPLLVSRPPSSIMLTAPPRDLYAPPTSPFLLMIREIESYIIMLCLSLFVFSNSPIWTLGQLLRRLWMQRENHQYEPSRRPHSVHSGEVRSSNLV